MLYFGVVSTLQLLLITFLARNMHFLSTISFQRMYTLFSFVVITNIFSVAMLVARDAPVRTRIAQRYKI